MALSLEDAVRVKQKARAETRRPKTQILLKALFEYINSHKSNPKLQLVPFDAISTATTGSGVILADVACRLYAAFVKSPNASTTSTVFKITDDETTASPTAIADAFTIPAAAEELFLWPEGRQMAAGIGVQATLTVASSTGSAAADRPSGFVIVGG